MLREIEGKYENEEGKTNSVNKLIKGIVYDFKISESQSMIFLTNSIRDHRYSDPNNPHKLFMIWFDKDWNQDLDLKKEFIHDYEIISYIYDENENK